MRLLAVDRYVRGDSFNFGYGRALSASYPDYAAKDFAKIDVDGHTGWEVPAHAVYVMYSSANEVLYVGITYQLRKRLRHHNYQSPWYDDITYIMVYWYNYSAHDEERRLIHELVPKYNKERWPYTG